MKARHAWPLTVLVLAACGSDISPRNDSGDDGNGGPDAALPGPGGAQAGFRADGTHYVGTIDATGSNWVYIDLVTQTQVTPSAPESSDAWDIAFRGSDIKLNGGASGSPPTGDPVTVYGDRVDDGTPYPFDDAAEAPPRSAVSYTTDAAGGPFASGPDYAMTTHPEADQRANPLTGAGDHGWYHDTGRLQGSTITARENVAYFLSTVECRTYKLRMTGFTRDGVPGHPQFAIAEIPGDDCSAPGGGGSGGVAPLGRATFEDGADSTIAVVDAAADDVWVHLDLTNAQQVAPADPAGDPGWDLALQRTDIRMNGGASGPADVALDDREAADWAAIAAADADAEWHADTADALAFVTYPPADPEHGAGCGPGAGDYGWYYYSSFCNDGEGIHHIYPRDVVYVLRGRDGNFWKLRVRAYYDDNGESAQYRIEYAPVAAP